MRISFDLNAEQTRVLEAKLKKSEGMSANQLCKKYVLAALNDVPISNGVDASASEKLDAILTAIGDRNLEIQSKLDFISKTSHKTNQAIVDLKSSLEA